MTSNPILGGLTPDDLKVWYTYHSNALTATREAIKIDKEIEKIVRPVEKDKDLMCIKDNLGKEISKSIISIILNVFTIEYRINALIPWFKKKYDKNLSEAKLNSYYDVNYHCIVKWDESEKKYVYDNNGTKKYANKTLSNVNTNNFKEILSKRLKFQHLSLYEKWRNIPYIKEDDNKIIIDYKPDDDIKHEKYIFAIKKLHKWIKLRNSIAHGDVKVIKEGLNIENDEKLKISIKSAVDCFDEITKAIFYLNIEVDYGLEKQASDACNLLLLMKN